MVWTLNTLSYFKQQALKLQWKCFNYERMKMWKCENEQLQQYGAKWPLCHKMGNRMLKRRNRKEKKFITKMSIEHTQRHNRNMNGVNTILQCAYCGNFPCFYRSITLSFVQCLSFSWSSTRNVSRTPFVYHGFHATYTKYNADSINANLFKSLIFHSFFHFISFHLLRTITLLQTNSSVERSLSCEQEC